MANKDLQYNYISEGISFYFPPAILVRTRLRELSCRTATFITFPCGN